MATYKKTTAVKASAVVYPSDHGSHATMVDDDYIEFNADDHGMIVCKDNRGSYLTTKALLDSGLCDMNRAMDTETRECKLKERVTG